MYYITKLNVTKKKINDILLKGTTDGLNKLFLIKLLKCLNIKDLVIKIFSKVIFKIFLTTFKYYITILNVTREKINEILLEGTKDGLNKLFPIKLLKYLNIKDLFINLFNL